MKANSKKLEKIIVFSYLKFKKRVIFMYLVALYFKLQLKKLFL